jgi:hypothetical protein
MGAFPAVKSMGSLATGSPRRAITGFDGFVANYMGDGVLVYFIAARIT